MYSQTGLSDFFDDLKKAGQDIIDQGAAAVGIDKGGVIDKAATSAADIGKKAGILPGNTSGNGYIDNDTMNTIDKFVNTGGSTSGGTSSGTSSGAKPADPNLQIKRTTSSTGSASSTPANSQYVTKIPSGNGLLEKVNPLVTGGVATVISYMISKRLALSAAIGTGTMLAQQAYKFNRS